MNEVGAPERTTQNRVVALFCEQLGYEYLGAWTKCGGNIIAQRLRAFLQKNNSETLTEAAIHKLQTTASPERGVEIYHPNKKVHRLLRYGAKIREQAGEHHQTVHFIDWQHPHNNDFAIGEEVTIQADTNKRPDIVLYINGIAVGVLELKRTTVSVGAGIRQNILNQQPDNIGAFFTTIQLVMAGNDTEGLRYGVIGAAARYFLEWKEQGGIGDCALDRHLSLLCEKSRLLELIYDFVVYDSGVKKICRHNQYFGVKAAQEKIRKRQGGIIWHTQGSGKSLTMVWLAKWILEKKQNARVLVVTDRVELDEQIKRVFDGVDREIYRAPSGAALMKTLNNTQETLMCSLVHKFFGAGGDDAPNAEKTAKQYEKEMRKNMPRGFAAKGDIYVFVDECHRSQSGAMHKAMKQLMPNAMFIGFTGTPLLKRDKQTSLEVFGGYIHTYKLDEAVKDGAIVDLCYESRNIEQRLNSPKKIDEWFEQNTAGLTEIARDKLKKRWAQMRKVLSSKSRLSQIVADILLDMETKPRLSDGRGNALLVAGSIYEACQFYNLFADTNLADQCAVVTSYRPNPRDLNDEEVGARKTENALQYETYLKMLAKFFKHSPDTAIDRADEFERKVKEKFIKQPGQMRLLIVVDKLLTGFDAPAATYLYIDKSMKDHGLFQAICRVNRLDDADKEYGYIVDYKDLFCSLEKAVETYTSEAFANYDEQDIAGLLNNRLKKAKQHLDQSRETVTARCEPVKKPRATADYITYFCGDPSDANDLDSAKEKRHSFYHETAVLIRAFAAIANDLDKIYAPQEIQAIKRDVKDYEIARREVQLASREHVDLKLYEPDMRHLIDQYIDADASEMLAGFDNIGLVELLVQHGEHAIDKLPLGIRNNKQATAETIENNVRRLIVDSHPSDPAYYDKMSQMLDALIQKRKADVGKYKEYLLELIEVAKQVHAGEGGGYVDGDGLSDGWWNVASGGTTRTAAENAIIGNLNCDAAFAKQLHHAFLDARQDDWQNYPPRIREMENAVRNELSGTEFDTDAHFESLFNLVKNRAEYK